MKYFFIAVGLLLATTGYTQIQDDFSDGDFSTNPEWVGATANYIVNTTQQLQLNQTVAGVSYLTTPLVTPSFDDKEWSFWIRQNFAGSATNYGRVYLIANSTDLSATPEGVYLQFGEANATDAIRLVQRNAGTTTVLCSTPDGSIANAFSSRVMVRRTTAGEWQLSVDFTGGMDVNLIATANEVAVPIGSNFGYLNVYTASNANRFYLDDVYYGDWVIDVTPPTIVSTSIVDNQTVQVVFSEPIANTVLDPAAWSFSPLLTLNSIAFIPNSTTTVRLAFASPLTNGQNYSFEVVNTTDLANNVAAILNGTFAFLVAEIAEIGDVIINEFFPDPSPVVGLPEYEFVELYNRSNKIFNLQGWKIADNTTQGTIATRWLRPGERVVLTAAANVSHFPQSVGVTNWAAINNTSDDVAIITAEGLELERVTFNLNWYHDPTKVDGGWTLERINPETSCSDWNNWRASVHPNGGTPGEENSVFDLTPDTIIPTIQSVVYSSDTLTINFSESIQAAELIMSDFEITPAVDVRSLISSNDLTPTIKLVVLGVQINQPYSITIPSVEDCSGNIASTTVASFQWRVAEIAEIGDVIINEFMADPTPVVGLPEVEFVEIYNRSNKVFNLQGWKLGDNSTYGTIGTYWLMPGEFVVLTANASVSQFVSNVVGVTSFPSLGNTSDEIRLVSFEGEMLDQLAYTLEWYHNEVKQEGGWTLERINPETICSSSANWRSSVNENGGTPGAQNSIYDLTPDTTPPAIQQFYVSNDTLYLFFNEAVQGNLFDIEEIQISPQANIQEVLIPNALATNIQLVFNEILSNTHYLLTLPSVLDCAGNGTDIQIDFGVPSAPSVGDILINEILFDPNTGGSDYVELYNCSNKWIDLKGWKLAKFASGTIGQTKEIGIHYLLQPNEYVVLTPDTLYVMNTFPFAVPGKFIQMSLPALNADSSTLYLITSLNGMESIMDQLSYTKGWHFKLLESPKGKSLERLSSDLPTQDRNNWHTAAESMGWGTPGMKNSQYSPAEYNGSLNFTNDVISPDNDGFEDVLQINYQMEIAGMIGTIRIFDDVGRVVKLLTNNELLGTEGSIIWDGVRDDGLKAKIGIYILVLEAYTIEGDSFKAKKAFTVAGKL